MEKKYISQEKTSKLDLNIYQKKNTIIIKNALKNALKMSIIILKVSYIIKKIKNISLESLILVMKKPFLIYLKAKKCSSIC